MEDMREKHRETILRGDDKSNAKLDWDKVAEIRSEFQKRKTTVAVFKAQMDIVIYNRGWIQPTTIGAGTILNR